MKELIVVKTNNSISGKMLAHRNKRIVFDFLPDIFIDFTYTGAGRWIAVSYSNDLAMPAKVELMDEDIRVGSRLGLNYKGEAMQAIITSVVEEIYPLTDNEEYAFE